MSKKIFKSYLTDLTITVGIAVSWWLHWLVPLARLRALCDGDGMEQLKDWWCGNGFHLGSTECSSGPLSCIFHKAFWECSKHEGRAVCTLCWLMVCLVALRAFVLFSFCHSRSFAWGWWMVLLALGGSCSSQHGPPVPLRVRSGPSATEQKI